MDKTSRYLILFKKYRFLVSVIGILFFIVFAVNGCDWSGNQKVRGKIDKVTLGVGSGVFLSPIWVAEDKGYFQEAGLDLTIKKFNTGKESFWDMLNGGTDISTSTSTPIVLASFSRQDFSIFATFSNSNNNTKVIARKDKGIHRAKDLKEKKIGVTAGTSAQFFLAGFLIHNALSDSEIQIIDIKPSDLPNALNGGHVDAIVIWEPFAYGARTLLGDKAIRLPSSEIYWETFNFAVMKNFVKKNPEALKKVIRAVEKAITFIREHKEESLKIVVKRTGLSMKIITDIWDDYLFQVSLEQALIQSLEEEARWAVENKLTDKREIPNYLNYIFMDTLKEIKSSAMTIIQ